MTIIKKIIQIVSFSVALLTAATVFAAQPNNQACLGEDISGYAQGGSAFGGFIGGLAQNTQGVGGEIQAHQAGLVPDEIIPNSCND